MTLVLHRFGAGLYFADDSPLQVCGLDGSWWIESVKNISDEQALQWIERNRSMYSERFQRLSEAREYLEALFELDPPLPYDMIPGEWLSPNKEEGGWLLQIPGDSQVFKVQRSGGGEPGWDLIREPWGVIDHFQTLWEMQSQRTLILNRTRALG